MSKARVRPITLTLPFEVIATLDRFSKAAGLSRSACASSLLKGVSPTLELAAQHLEGLNELSERQRKEIGDEMAFLEKQAQDHQQETAAINSALTSLIHSAKFSKN